MVSNFVPACSHAQHYRVQAAPPHATSTGEPQDQSPGQSCSGKQGQEFPTNCLWQVSISHLCPLLLLPGASHTNLDEGVNFNSPAFGKCFNLHLANRAHIQMVHSRAAPKPEHRKRGRGIKNCGRMEMRPSPASYRDGFLYYYRCWWRRGICSRFLNGEYCLYSTQWGSQYCSGQCIDIAHFGLN